MGRLAGACTLILGICLTALPAGAAQRVALVVGNSDYKLISSLANPANDAALMAETLRAVGFDVVEAQNADQRAMKRAISDFGRRLEAAGKDGVGLFYYAGHAVEARGVNYLIPLGAQIERVGDLDIEAVSAQWVLTQMEIAGNGLNVVILDSCRNNPYKGSFRAATRGLARMRAPTGSWIAYSAAPGKLASDGEGSNSPYTAALAAAIREPGLKLEEAFKRVRARVHEQSGGKQTPWEEGSVIGDFYFVPQGSTVTVTPPRTSPAQPQPAFDARALELAFWQSIKDSDNPADFGAYLTQYPQGTFAGLARLRRDGLKDRAEETAVAALPPAAATPGYGIEEIDETYYVLKRANVRSGPGTRFEKVGRLSPGAEVGVTGKVSGKPWLRIALEGGEDAYVYGPLLSAEKPKPPEPVAVAEKPRPAEKQFAVGVYPKAGRQAGETFKDCPECPEMVVIPAGRFRMGDLNGDGADREKPVHAVNIGYQFAVGKFEVTFDEWAACVADGGCGGYRPDDWGWGRGRRPVIDVSWDDAKAYVRWLSGKTRQAYRLLSETEWEYVARAGTSTLFSTGSTISPDQANYDGNYTYGSGRKGVYRERTVPVGSFSSNAFGLYDVHGNVWEWTEDCWHDGYHGAAGDGGAWTTGADCDKRVLRGGSWIVRPWGLRSAFRFGDSTDYRNLDIGFRVARTF